MNPQITIVKEFCSTPRNKLYSAGVRKRKSILLQIRDDIDYCIGLPGFFRPLNLTRDEQAKLDTQLAPLFVAPLLFCSAVDLIARVDKKGVPQDMSLKQLFIHSATQFFGMSNEEANHLWKFRCSLSHQYSIRGYAISRYGNSSVVLEKINDNVVVYVRPMKQVLAAAISKLEESLSQESEEARRKTSAFLNKHGFTYYLI